MPVARIISSSFEDAVKFAEYLRPVFDTVEIAQPGRAYDTSVDLEVNLEVCTAQQAWEQVAHFGNQQGIDIFVAPDILVSSTSGDGVQMPAEAEPLVAEPAERMQQDAVNGIVEAGISEASAAVARAAGSNGNAAHAHQVAEPVEPELSWLGRARESLRQWLAVRALLREIRQMEQQRLAEDQQRQKQMALQFERQRREQEAEQLELARAIEQPPLSVPEPRPHQQEEDLGPEPQPVLRQADEEQLRLQAEQEEAIRRGVFVEEILRRRVQEAVPQAAPLDAEPVPVEFEIVPEESFAAVTAPTRIASRPRARRSDRLKPAMALAGVSSILLLAALVGYAHRRPASPVPLAVLQRSNVVQQKVPFGPAVLPAPVSTSLSATEAPVQSTPEESPTPVKHDVRRDFRRVRIDSHEVDYISDDVTIRHFRYGHKLPPRSSLSGPAAVVPVTASSDGVKRISDME